MARLGFRRSTLLDAAVNAVPLAIIVFLFLLFLALDPWPADPLSLFWYVVLHVTPVVTLLVATAAAAWLIQADEEARGES